MISEHFYTISNTFMQFPYTLIWSRALSYNPKLNLNPHSRNTLFNRKRWLKKGIAGMKIWVLVILHTFIWSETLLCNFRTLLYDPEHSYTVIILSNIYDGAYCKAFTIHKLFMHKKFQKYCDVNIVWFKVCLTTLINIKYDIAKNISSDIAKKAVF